MKNMMFLCILLLAGAVAHAQATAACTADTTAATSLATGQTALTYTDSTVADGQAYDYMVTAVDPYGYACSNIVSNVTIPATGTHSVTLTWVASTTPGVTYSVFRAQTPAPPTALTAAAN